MSQYEFLVGTDNFDDLEVCPTASGFHFFYNPTKKSIVKRFILAQHPNVTYQCVVTMIEKDRKFTPRMEFSCRDNKKRIVEEAPSMDEEGRPVRARVDFDGCHENFWKLLSYVTNFPGIDIPRGRFSTVAIEDKDVLSAVLKMNDDKRRDVFRILLSAPGLTLTKEDINLLLRRKENLAEFEKELSAGRDETWWQKFFEKNKWIFGYGLNYEIIDTLHPQPHYGSLSYHGKGDQRGDVLGITKGTDARFTVLVEIKRPTSPLLQGKIEIRNGSWSLSGHLTDALAQIQGNIDQWNKGGSRQAQNVRQLESQGIFTVQPKGILVIGKLSELNPVSKLETFQRFRKSVHGVDVLTFDELLDRARFIVDHTQA